jgi:lipopolysaccharide export system ATP-binding protein
VSAPAPSVSVQPPTIPAQTAPELLSRGLSKSFGKRVVVKNVDLRVARGEIVALFGPNGAGKTTTFYMMVGFIRPGGGQILLRGEDITRLPMH